jgi:hypothetical protein
VRAGSRAGNISNQITDAKLLTLTCSSMVSGRLSPVRLKNHDTTTLKDTQKAVKTSGSVQRTPGHPPQSAVRKSGMCHSAQSGPRIIVAPSGPKRACRRGRAKSRQPGSSARPVVIICSSSAGT